MAQIINCKFEENFPDLSFKPEVQQGYGLGSYTSIQDFFRYFRITIPTKKKQCPPWRLTPRVKGHIAGLPDSYGILVATDGIMCYIDQAASREVLPYMGHVQYFVPDADQDVDMWEIITGKGRKDAKSPETTRAERVIAAIAELGY